MLLTFTHEMSADNSQVEYTQKHCYSVEKGRAKASKQLDS